MVQWRYNHHERIRFDAVVFILAGVGLRSFVILNNQTMFTASRNTDLILIN